MNKLLLLLILSFFSSQGFAAGCPDGSEPVKSVSDDGSYFEYKCSANSNSGLCEASVESKLLPKPIEETQELSDSEFSTSQFQILSAFKFPLYRSYGSEMVQGKHLKGAGINPEIKGVADFNRDGIDDLIVHFYESDVPPLILYGDADGKMRQEENVSASAARRHIRNAEVADLNNDGWLDFAGFTTGAPGERWIAEGYSTGGKHIPRGQADVVLINMQGKGFKELRVPEVRTNDWNHGGSVGDIDGDGWLDILTLSEGQNEFTVPLINQGGNAFKLSQYPYSDEISHYLTSDLDSGDLNSDGFVDIVVSMDSNQDRNPENLSRIGSMRIIYGDGDFDFSNNRYLKMGSHWLSQNDYESFKQRIQPQNVKSKAGSGHAVGRLDAGTTNVEIMDINGDGALDILQGYYITVSGLWQTSGFKAYLNNGDCFIDATDVLFPNQKINRYLGLKQDRRTNYIHNFHKADINNDGYSDLILQVDGTSNWHELSMLHSPFVFLNDGNFRYLPANSAMVEWDNPPQDDMVPGDFNGDGFVDIATIKKIDGQPEPELMIYLWITDEARRIAQEDLDKELAAREVQLEEELAVEAALIAAEEEAARIVAEEAIEKEIAELEVQLEEELAVEAARIAAKEEAARIAAKEEAARIAAEEEACKVSELNDEYIATWFLGDVNNNQAPESMGTERLILNACVGEFEGVKSFQPSKELRKNLQVTYKTNGQITISGHIDLWEVGRSFHTVLEGDINSGVITGAWEEGDLIKIEITKANN